MEIPVVTVHKYGVKTHDIDYVTEVVMQAACNNKVYSLLDSIPQALSTPKYRESIILQESLLTEEYTRFTHAFTNFNTLPHIVVEHMLSKFFLLKEFMNKFNYKEIFHIDSDVLLYTSVESLYEYYSHFDFTLSHDAVSNSFIKKDVVDYICQSLLDIYESKNFWFNDFKLIFEKMQSKNLRGGICDMALLNHIKTKKKCNPNDFLCGDMTVIINNKTFDHHIRHDDGQHVMKDGRKNIQFINNKPFCYNNYLQTNIEFLSLHFQGGAK